MHTAAHRAKQGAFLPRPQRGLVLPVNSFLFRHAFIYIHFPVHCEPPLSAERKIRRNCRHKFYPQPFLIPAFNFLHKRPTFAFTSESGYTLGSLRKIAHKGTHGETGAFPPSTTVRLCVASELLFILYTYISRFTVNLHYQQREKSGETAAINFIPNRFSSQFSTSPANGPRSLSQAKAGTHSPFEERSHTRAHTAKQGHFGWGGAITTLRPFCVVRKPCVAGT